MNTDPTVGHALRALRPVRLTGSPEQLRNRVTRYRACGQLAELTVPQPVPGRPGVLTCVARLYGGSPQVSTPGRPTRRRWPYMLAAVIVALALLCWAVYALITAVASVLAAAGPLLLGVLFLGALLLFGTSAGRTCITTITVTHRH